MKSYQSTGLKSINYLFTENITVNLNFIGCGSVQKCMWVQKEMIKSFSEWNPLLITKLHMTPSSGNSQAAGCQQQAEHTTGRIALKSSSILDLFPKHPTQVTVRNKLLSEMCFGKKTPPGFALHSEAQLLSRQWCQQKSNSSVWCMHL